MFYPHPLEFEIAQRSGERCARRCEDSLSRFAAKRDPRAAEEEVPRGAQWREGALGGGPKSPSEGRSSYGIKVRFRLDEHGRRNARPGEAPCSRSSACGCFGKHGLWNGRVD